MTLLGISHRSSSALNTSTPSNLQEWRICGSHQMRAQCDRTWTARSRYAAIDLLSLATRLLRYPRMGQQAQSLHEDAGVTLVHRTVHGDFEKYVSNWDLLRQCATVHTACVPDHPHILYPFLQHSPSVHLYPSLRPRPCESFVPDKPHLILAGLIN